MRSNELLIKYILDALTHHIALWIESLLLDNKLKILKKKTE